MSEREVQEIARVREALERIEQWHAAQEVAAKDQRNVVVAKKGWNDGQEEIRACTDRMIFHSTSAATIRTALRTHLAQPLDGATPGAAQ